MKDRKKTDEDFEGLDKQETASLSEVADHLRSESAPNQDDVFWTALKQRIVRDVAVTRPRRGPQERQTVGQLIRRWGRSLTSANGRRALSTAVVLTLIALGIAFFPRHSTDRATTITPVARQVEAPAQVIDPARPILIPEDLWADGFLAHEAPSFESIDAISWADELDGVVFGDSLDAVAYDESFSPSGVGWGLENLTLEELAELEQMLDG